VAVKKDKGFGIENIKKGPHDDRLLDGNKENMTI